MILSAIELSARYNPFTFTPSAFLAVYSQSSIVNILIFLKSAIDWESSQIWPSLLFRESRIDLIGKVCLKLALYAKYGIHFI